MTDDRGEAERRRALRALRIFGAAPEPHFDAVCRIAADLFAVPIAVVLFVDGPRLRFKARHGIALAGIDREGSACALTLQGRPGAALVLPDLAADPRLADSPYVTGAPHARFYAGVPLALASGLTVGTLCIADTVPRPGFGAAAAARLEDLAGIVTAHLRLQESRLRHEAETRRRQRAQRAVQAREQRFRLLAETTGDVIILSDLDTTRRYVSPAARRVLGYEPEALVGTRPLDFVHPDDAADYARVLADLTAARVERVVTCQRYRHRNGAWLVMEVAQSLARDPGTGRVTGYVTSLRDVTARKAAEDALRLSEERLALVLDSSSDGFWDWDFATGAIALSDNWSTMLDYAVGELPATIATWRGLVHPDDLARAQETFRAHVAGRSALYECECRLRTRAGGYIWTLARGRIVARDGKGRPRRVVGTHVDITRRKRAEQQIAHMAVHDALTGLPNRALFWERLTAAIAAAMAPPGPGRRGVRFAVLACDLDRFKSVNDTLGHPAGDALLRTLAARLAAVIRAGDTVARLGGDEFALVLPGLRHPGEARRMAARIVAAVGRPVEIEGSEVRVGISIGIVLGGADGRDAGQLFKQADIALYQAKAAGRNTVRFYEQDLGRAVTARSALETDIRNAVERDGFSLSYQPVFEVGGGPPHGASPLPSRGLLRGFEALMRWQHPTRGSVPPAEFIPLAEETGLIVGLGGWALRAACREAAAWLEPLRVAVNVSAVQFAQGGVEAAVAAALAASGLAPHRLELEITESVLLAGSEDVVATLHRLRALGVRIALDDFGTGYSSLSYLCRFPFDKIKIDRAFVRAVADPGTAAIVRAIVGLGTHLGCTITAEGVETAEQLERVRQEGCTEVQGYLLGRPLPPAEARALIGAGPGRAAA